MIIKIKEDISMAEDRRVRYTKMVLKEALLKLMREKPLSRISITAICEEADINRATYYSHYTDQYDQLNKIEMEFTEGINNYLDTYVSETDSLQMIEGILEYVFKNKDLCNVLLSPNGDIRFEEKVREVIRERVFAVWKVSPLAKGVADEYIYTYTLAGCVGIVKKWLADPKTFYKPKEFASLIYMLTEKGSNPSIKER